MNRRIVASLAFVALVGSAAFVASHAASAAQPSQANCCCSALDAAHCPTPPPATPTPSPTPTPTPAPTPTPGANQYVYHGVNVWPAGDTFNTDYSGYPIDANSATILSQLPSGTFDDEGDVQSAYEANLGTSTTPVFTVQTNGGHHPPCYNYTAGPWVNGWFIEPLSDAHAISLLTDNGLDYESYGTKWTSPSGPLAAYSCQRNNLNATWASQAVAGHDAVTASGIPYMGTTDWGEDFSLSVINHILSFAMKTGHGYSQWGYVSPATSPSGVADTGCGGSACHHPIHNGDILILDASFDCSGYTTIGQKVCAQFKRGIILRDQAGGYTPTLGLTTNGTKGANYTTDLKPFFSAVGPSQLHVIQEGTIKCAYGHTLGVDCW